MFWTKYLLPVITVLPRQLLRNYDVAIGRAEQKRATEEAKSSATPTVPAPSPSAAASATCTGTVVKT